MIDEPVETRIRPIPARSNTPRIKSTSRPSKSIAKSAEHQIDGQRQWEAMQATDPKPQVKPLNSLLGLIGFSVIEADQASASTQIAQQYHTTPSQGNIGRVGPVGNSRLDRLPRPGQRASMTLPPGSFSSGSMDGTTYAPMQFGSRYSKANLLSRVGSILASQFLVRRRTWAARWLQEMGCRSTGRKLIACNPIGMQQMPVGSGMAPAQHMIPNGANYAAQPIANPIPLENSAWHGLSPRDAKFDRFEHVQCCEHKTVTKQISIASMSHFKLPKSNRP